MTAVAISNNDMVYLHWNVSGKIPDCLGFNIIRHDAISNDHEPLPAMVGFPSPDKSDGKKGKTGVPKTKALEDAIKKPGNPLRTRLVGDLENGVLKLLERARKEGGQCYCALYELSDKDLVDNLAALKDKVHIVLSNAGEDTKKGAGDGDKTNTHTRVGFHKLKLDVTDRMLKKGHIGHNKFEVYVGKNGPEAVL